MVERPTEEELIQLYLERGKDILVLYARRNALRALLFLGNVPLNQIWQKSTVHNVYSICRVAFLFIGDTPPTDDIVKVSGRAARIAADQVNADVHGAYAYATAADSAAAVTDAFYYMTYASTVDDALAIANDRAVRVANAASASADASAHAYAAVADAVIKAKANEFSSNAAARLSADKVAKDALATAYAIARSDLIDLSNKDISSIQQWFELPLWPNKERLFKDDTSNSIEKLETQLAEQLKQLGLGFLAEDLRMLWSGDGCEIDLKRIKKYAQNYSETVTNDPAALRQAILGGDAIEEIHAVRCLLLGPGGAGKSSLADRLQGKNITPVKRLTVGIDYLEHQALNLQTTFPGFGLEYNNLDLYLWDFGGQTIFHGLHSAFLHPAFRGYPKLLTH